MSNKSCYVVTQNGHPTLVFAGGESARKWIAGRGTKDINGNSIVWRAEKFEFMPLTLDDETEEDLRAEARRHMRRSRPKNEDSMNRNDWPVGDHGIRPAGDQQKCFYCDAAKGAQHRMGCVIRNRTVVR